MRPTNPSHQPPTGHRGGLSYEGQVLPRPDDELVDQGLQFDMATMFSRRRMLSWLGLGAGALTLAACGRGGDDTTASTASAAESGSTGGTAAPSSAGTVLEIPDETNGPYPADGTNGPDILEQSGVVRSDITSSFGGATGVANGVPLTFSLNVIDMANGNVPFAGAAVYVWHCDAEGRYSMYSEGVENENYLRGVQVADSNGQVTFTSIFPACYAGRWPHIHFEVYPDLDSITDHDNCISTSQAAFPEDACNDVYGNVALYSGSVETFANVSIDSDGIFTPDTIDQQMLTLTGDPDGGYTGSLVVPIDAATEQSASMGGGPGGAPGGEGGPDGSRPEGPPPGGGPAPTTGD